MITINFYSIMFVVWMLFATIAYFLEYTSAFWSGLILASIHTLAGKMVDDFKS